MVDFKATIKPLLRGYFHQEAFFVTLGAGAMLIAKSSHGETLISSLIYTIGLLMMFGISALYHRPHWQPKARSLLKRLDHSAIFILIASTATPLCLLALPKAEGDQFLIVIWCAAIAGILQSIFWTKAPKMVTAIFYIVMGWLAVPYLADLKSSLGPLQLSLLIVGGVFYTLGAGFYALKRPRLFPAILGYH
ncbi:hemolysin III, partial [bacterium]|nr:hemolysin III [bacterium]